MSLWPENVAAIDLFQDFSTQWRAGMGGAHGLDYSVIQHELTRRNVDDAAYLDLMACIRVIESVAIEELNKK